MSDEGHVDAGVIVIVQFSFHLSSIKPEQWAVFRYINEECYREITLLQL